MPYNSNTDRTDAGALIPEDASREIIQQVPESSFMLSGIFPKVTMSRKQRRMPALAALPLAYFVNGDTGLKQTSDLSWENRYLNAEEIAVIVPIPEAVLDDADFDIWGEATPKIAEAIGRTFDAAVLFNTNAPAAWDDAVTTAAIAAGNVYNLGTATAAEGGVAEDINQTMALMEADGFDAGAFVTDRTMRATLRSARDTTGQKLLDISAQTIEGSPLRYACRGQWGSGDGASRMIAMDPSQFIVGVRQDLTYKILDQAVITDANGAVVYNLAQQDMVALRVVFRGAWVCANPLTHENSNSATRYPAAVLRNAPAES